MNKTTAKQWFSATRPKTLTAAATPVIVASALAFRDGYFYWKPALICLLFALTAQIVSNFANDYFDYKKGIDNAERSGPKRAVAEGWIAPRTMLRVTVGLLAADLLLGLSLLRYGGWELIFAGMAIAVFALAYSGGAYPLSSHGWGDVCVFFFFGIIPAGFTYYVQALRWDLPVTVCGIAVGLVIVNILVANNYRDRDSDAKTGKKTTVVLFGEKFGRRFYLFNGVSAVICCLYFLTDNAVWAAVFPFVYLFLHIKTWREMVRIGNGRELNRILGQTAMNAMVFGLLLALGFLAGLFL
ncbi:MAG: 1,4-dihydroxy-2-naphthoate octaprenyltransferase [Dysgonamonadaceae bacterium]|jgi:1,4-dihydroxy-2-naphthoate octaprenyltransferase|nr:1,4-dihydroxy-2-naphthoate octaprenyltransferase [Dysgonamonadaceae bacterium]